MMHSVYEIRVTLLTKKSMRSGRDGWRRCRLAPQPRPRTEVSCQLPFIPGHGGIRGIEIDGMLEIARF
jgi:hypothetical protein